MMSRPAERKLRRQERAVEVELRLKKVLFFTILHKNEAKEHTCKKLEIAEIYLRKFFWTLRKILG